MKKPVLFEMYGNTALITLNRPEKRNAISQELLIHLYNYLDKVADDPEIRAAIITGAGDSFCAGLDLGRLTTDNLMDPRGDGRGLVEILADNTKPIIGAINGHAMTGGFEIALNCDFLIASQNASFADTHAKIGIHPGWGMSQLLRQAVGIRMARQMSFTCGFFSAETALLHGLVNEVVDREKLIPRCLEIADEISRVNQEMLGVVRELIKKGDDMGHNDAMELEQKGFKAFLDKAGILK